MPDVASGPLDPLYEAVGRAVISTAGLEVWLYIAVSTFTSRTYDQADKANASDAIRRLSLLTEAMPSEERDHYADVISTARRVTEDRNGLSHGVWWPNEDHTVIQSQRPPRIKEDSLSHDPNRPAWIKKTFTRRSLLALCDDCRWACGQFQINLTRWGDMLRQDRFEQTDHP